MHVMFTVLAIIGIVFIAIGAFVELLSLFWAILTLVKGKGPSQIFGVSAVMYCLGIMMHGALLFDFALLDALTFIGFHAFLQLVVPKVVSFFVDNRDAIRK